MSRLTRWHLHGVIRIVSVQFLYSSISQYLSTRIAQKQSLLLTYRSLSPDWWKTHHRLSFILLCIYCRHIGPSWLSYMEINIGRCILLFEVYFSASFPKHPIRSSKKVRLCHGWLGGIYMESSTYVKGVFQSFLDCGDESVSRITLFLWETFSTVKDLCVSYAKQILNVLWLCIVAEYTHSMKSGISISLGFAPWNGIVQISPHYYIHSCAFNICMLL